MAAVLAGSVQPAVAKSAGVFPVEPSLVPLVVAAVFALPAAMAGMFSVVTRRRWASQAVAAGLLVAAAMVVAARHPEIVAALRS